MHGLLPWGHTVTGQQESGHHLRRQKGTAYIVCQVCRPGARTECEQRAGREHPAPVHDSMEVIRKNENPGTAVPGFYGCCDNRQNFWMYPVIRNTTWLSLWEHPGVVSLALAGNSPPAGKNLRFLTERVKLKTDSDTFLVLPSPSRHMPCHLPQRGRQGGFAACC